MGLGLLLGHFLDHDRWQGLYDVLDLMLCIVVVRMEFMYGRDGAWTRSSVYSEASCGVGLASIIVVAHHMILVVTRT